MHYKILFWYISEINLDNEVHDYTVKRHKDNRAFNCTRFMPGHGNGLRLFWAKVFPCTSDIAAEGTIYCSMLSQDWNLSLLRQRMESLFVMLESRIVC